MHSHFVPKVKTGLSMAGFPFLERSMVESSLFFPGIFHILGELKFTSPTKVFFSICHKFDPQKLDMDESVNGLNHPKTMDESSLVHHSSL